MKSKLVVKIYDETGRKQDHKEFIVQKEEGDKYLNLIEALCTKGVQTNDRT